MGCLREASPLYIQRLRSACSVGGKNGSYSPNGGEKMLIYCERSPTKQSKEEHHRVFLE